MTWNRTIITGAVLVAMILLAFLDRKIIENRIIDAVQERSLAPVDASRVKEIRLRNPMGEAVLARDATGAWRLKSPTDAPADPETVEQLLINVTAANRTNEIEATQLAEYGLSNPDTEVTFVHTPKDGGGKEAEFSLQLGHESTYTGLVFAKYPGEKKVFTVGQHVKSVLSRAPLDFRRSRLFDVDTGDLDSYSAITLRGRDSVVTLKGASGRWRITAPLDAPAEAEIVREYLRKAGLLRATGFLAEKSDRPTSVAAALEALSSPTLTVTLERAGQSPESLTIATAEGAAGPVVVARRGGDSELLVLRSETLEDLRQDANFFRSRELFSLTPEETGALRVRIGHAVTDLVRDEKGLWRFRMDADRKVDQMAVSTLLETLLQLRIKQYIDPNPTNAGDYGIPRFTFMVTDKEGRRAEIVETGNFERGNPSSAYARRSGDPAIFTTEISKDLIVTPDLVADRHFARVNVEEVRRLEIVSDEATHTLQLEDGEWKIRRSGQTAFTSADRRKVERLFALLDQMEYERDLSAMGDTVITPPAEAPMALRMYGEGDTALLELTTGRRLPDRTYLFVSPGRTIEALNPAVDRLQMAVRSLVQ